MDKDNSEGALGELKKVKGVTKTRIVCSRPECKNLFDKRGPKRYCCAKCQWTHYNETHPVGRKIH